MGLANIIAVCIAIVVAIVMGIFFFGIADYEENIRELSIELCNEKGWEFKSATQECISLEGDWLVTKANIIIHKGEAYLSMVGGDK